MDVKNFFEGMGSALELFSSSKDRDSEPAIPCHSDEEAIKQDWQKVGNDIKDAATMGRKT